MKTILENAREMISETISANGDVFSPVWKLSESNRSGLYSELNVSSLTDGSYVLTIQHSPDMENWYDLTSSAARTTNGQTLTKEAEDNVLSFIRFKLSSSGVTTGATVTARLHY